MNNNAAAVLLALSALGRGRKVVLAQGEMVEIGGYISFTGIMTFKKAEDVREAMKRVPNDRLMFETDSPYLAPVPYRGKRNEPAYVKQVVEFAADYLGVDYQELVDRTTENALRFYGLQSP